MSIWRITAAVFLLVYNIQFTSAEETEEGWNRGKAACGSIMHYDANAPAPVGWYQCYIDEHDKPYHNMKCQNVVAGSHACGGYGAINFGCWHGKSGKQRGAVYASNNVVARSCRNNIQQTTKLAAWDRRTTTLGIGISCPHFNKPQPGYKNLGKLACGTKMRHDPFAKTPNGWYQCYIDQRDTKYHNWQCSDIVKNSNVCGGKGYYNFGCWHGTTKSPFGAAFATNNVVASSCINNRQQSTRLNAWNWKTTTLGIGVRCKPFSLPTTTTTTTTTTTKASVLIKTWMLPEFSLWKITTEKGKKTVCKGGPYSSWYTTITDKCRLVQQKTYKIVCSNTHVKGWAGSYVQVNKKKLCENYTYDKGPAFTETFTVA